MRALTWFRAWVVFVSLLATLPLSTASAQQVERARLVDGVAAVIGGSSAGPDVDVILRSDVELRARILLSGERGRLVEGAISGYWLAQALEQMVGEALIAREAERVRVATPTEIDQRAERTHLEELAGGSQMLATVMALMRVSQAELTEMVRRRALVAVFLTANLDRVTVITDAEIERAYEHAKDQLGGRSLDETREMIRVQLAREAMQSTVAQWVASLRARTTVNVVADYLGQRSSL
jgi:hypothetical protein